MPAITSTDICNRALQKIGAKRISALTDQTPAGRACNLAYDIIRRSELRKHVWNFAIERASIAADSPAPTWGRANSFTVPADFIRLTNNYPEDFTNTSAITVSIAFASTSSGFRDWVIEQDRILTNDGSPLQIRYVFDVTDTSLFDPIFSEALSTAIAFEICEEVTQSNTKKDSLGQAYMALISDAKKINAIEVAPAEPPPDIWLTCRG